MSMIYFVVQNTEFAPRNPESACSRVHVNSGNEGYLLLESAMPYIYFVTYVEHY